MRLIYGSMTHTGQYDTTGQKLEGGRREEDEEGGEKSGEAESFTAAQPQPFPQTPTEANCALASSILVKNRGNDQTSKMIKSRGRTPSLPAVVSACDSSAPLAPEADGIILGEIIRRS